MRTVSVKVDSTFYHVGARNVTQPHCGSQWELWANKAEMASLYPRLGRCNPCPGLNSHEILYHHSERKTKGIPQAFQISGPVN